MQQIHDLYNIFKFQRMNRFTKQMQERFEQQLNQMSDPDGSDAENSMGQSFFQTQKMKMQQAWKSAQTKKQNVIVKEYQKLNAEEVENIKKFQEQMEEMKNITNNNQNGIIDQSVLEDIKKKVFNQSMLNTMQLADKQIEEKAKKQEQEKKIEKTEKQKKKQINHNEAEALLIKKKQSVRIQQQNIAMGRQDELSHKYENHMLSQFFKERFVDPKFPKPIQKCPNIQIKTIKPKQTFTNLMPLPNTEQNVLPKNSPEIALRKLARAPKIKLEVSSKTEVKVKIKEIVPKFKEKEIKSELEKQKKESNKIQQVIKEYVKFVEPKMKEIQKISEKYRPKLINEFVGKSEQTNNMDINNEDSRSLGEALFVEEQNKIKELKFTFERIKDTKGIKKLKNLQHGSLQYNLITNISEMQHCSKLIQINLSHNKLKSVRELQDLKWLRYVNIQHNSVQSLCLKGGSIQILLAGNNKIQQIIDLSHNANMKKLILNHNKIHELNGLKNLHFLQEINLKHNYIKILQGIQDCILLRVLDISQNRVQKISHQFSYIFLNQLYLTQNMLTSLPNMFLPSLEELYIDKNKLTQESKSIIYLPSLKVLNIDDNHLLGFGTVWSLLRYSHNLQVLKYDRNQCFLHIRQKVRELYEFIIYKNMHKLKLLNQSYYDMGVKKYYESAYSDYLSRQSLFQAQNPELQHIKNKIMFVIGQNKCQSQLQKNRKKFTEEDVFIKYKSVRKSQDLLQIFNFLNNPNENILLKGKNSLFYEHDKFQTKLRSSLHKIQTLVYKIRYYLKKKKKYYQKNKPKIQTLMKDLSQIFLKIEVRKAINKFHKPLEKMNGEKAAIMIQKHWRRYRVRKRYLRAIDKLNNRSQDTDSLPPFQDFPQEEEIIPNFDIEQFNFQQYIIKPQLFQAVELKKNERQEKYGKKQQKKPKLVNNFVEEGLMMQNDSIPVSEMEIRRNRKQEEEEKIMNEWGFKNKGTMLAMQLKKKKKEERIKKEAQKNLSAKQRYERFKNNYHK